MILYCGKLINQLLQLFFAVVSGMFQEPLLRHFHTGTTAFCRPIGYHLLRERVRCLVLVMTSSPGNAHCLVFVVMHSLSSSFHILRKKYSAFRFNFSARLINFTHYVWHNRPEYLFWGRKIKSQTGSNCPERRGPFHESAARQLRGAVVLWWRGDSELDTHSFSSR